MIYTRRELASGESINELRQRVEELYERESNLPEWTRMELVLRTGISGTPLRAVAASVNQTLAAAHVERWDENDGYAYTQGDELIIRWVKGFPWLPVILGVLAAAAVVVIFWRLFTVHPITLALAAGVGIGILALAFWGPYIIGQWIRPKEGT